MIKLTESAAGAVKEILKRENKEDWGLRVGVSGGGCSGLNYDLEVKEGPQEGDQVGESAGIKVFIDPKAYMYLVGTEIDYVTSMLGGGFKFNNPNAKKTCGCGTSFSPE
jgi:iron-sulfur cluster assembly accessory protein